MDPKASLNSGLTRDALFEALRNAMRAYSWQEKLGDLGEVASDMEMWGDGSWDPAYKAEFDELLPDCRYALDGGMLLAPSLSDIPSRPASPAPWKLRTRWSAPPVTRVIGQRFLQSFFTRGSGG
jgi:hypothetical protein